MKQRYFTLVELLVTLAIIGILAALTMGSVNRARESARRSRCLANLSQLGIGLEMYGQDHRYVLPVCAGSQDPHAGQEIRSVLLGYVSGNNGVFRCPSDLRAESLRSGSSYDWNTLANGRKMDEKTLKVLAFELPVMADYDNFHGKAGRPDAKNWLYLPVRIQKQIKR